MSFLGTRLLVNHVCHWANDQGLGLTTCDILFYLLLYEDHTSCGNRLNFSQISKVVKKYSTKRLSCFILCKLIIFIFAVCLRGMNTKQMKQQIKSKLINSRTNNLLTEVNHHQTYKLKKQISNDKKNKILQLHGDAMLQMNRYGF